MKLTDAIRTLKDHEPELKTLGVQNLYIFGSTARGEEHPHSDIDLFFDYEKGTLGLGLIDIREAATRILGCEADIMTRSSISPYIRASAEAEAVAVF